MYARGQMLLPTYQRPSAISLSVLFWHYVLQQPQQIPGFSLFNKHAKVVVTAFVKCAWCSLYVWCFSLCSHPAGTPLLACSDAGSSLRTPGVWNRVELEQNILCFSHNWVLLREEIKLLMKDICSLFFGRNFDTSFFRWHRIGKTVCMGLFQHRTWIIFVASYSSWVLIKWKNCSLVALNSEHTEHLEYSKAQQEYYKFIIWTPPLKKT